MAVIDLDLDDMPDSELSYALRRAAAIRQDAAFVRAMVNVHPERFIERPCDTEAE
jgi:hypothetical protein